MKLVVVHGSWIGRSGTPSIGNRGSAATLTTRQDSQVLLVLHAYMAANHAEACGTSKHPDHIADLAPARELAAPAGPALSASLPTPCAGAPPLQLPAQLDVT